MSDETQEFIKKYNIRVFRQSHSQSQLQTQTQSQSQTQTQTQSQSQSQSQTEPNVTSLQVLEELKKWGLNDSLFDRIITDSTIRKEQRIKEQLSPTDPSNKRGRPASTTLEAQQQNRAHYEKHIQRNDLTRENLKTWLSCLLIMGLRRFKNLSSYWAKPLDRVTRVDGMFFEIATKKYRL
jgi:hypothetical protein